MSTAIAAVFVVRDTTLLHWFQWVEENSQDPRPLWKAYGRHCRRRRPEPPLTSHGEPHWSVLPFVHSEPLGRIFSQLFTDNVPKTAESFHALSPGEKDLVMKVVPAFTELIPDLCARMTGTRHHGTGGEAIYGEKFEDKNFFLAKFRNLSSPDISYFPINSWENIRKQYLFSTLFILLCLQDACIFRLLLHCLHKLKEIENMMALLIIYILHLVLPDAEKPWETLINDTYVGRLL